MSQRLNITKDQSIKDSYKPLAELVENFQKKTPLRFRSRPLKSDCHEKPKIKKVPTKRPTIIEEFDLEFKRNNWQHNDSGVSSKSSNIEYVFKANPLPRKIFTRTVGIKPVETRPITIPESPNFMKRVLRNREMNDTLIANDHIIKANPMPNLNSVFQPVIKKRMIENEPFSFETRDKDMLGKKNQKIKKILEENLSDHEFHANPLPNLDVKLPPKKTISPTKLEPFKMEIDERARRQHEEWKKKLLDEEKKAKEMKKFKARPALVLEQVPFVPEKKEKPVTVPIEFHLHTETRAEQRQVLDKIREEHQLEQQEMDRLKQQQLLEVMEKELKEMRTKTVTRAHSVRTYKPVEIHNSEIALTEPISPNFSSRLRPRK